MTIEGRVERRNAKEPKDSSVQPILTKHRTLGSGESSLGGVSKDRQCERLRQCRNSASGFQAPFLFSADALATKNRDA
jgi:hypothetical protein